MGAVRYELDSLTFAIEKTFTKIVANYYGETTTPPPYETHCFQMQGKNPYRPPHRRDEAALMNNEVEKASFTRATSTP